MFPIIIPMSGLTASGPPRCIHCGKAYPYGNGFFDNHPAIGVVCIVVVMLSAAALFACLLLTGFEWFNGKKTLLQIVADNLKWIWNLLHRIA